MVGVGAQVRFYPYEGGRGVESFRHLKKGGGGWGQNNF